VGGRVGGAGAMDILVLRVMLFTSLKCCSGNFLFNCCRRRSGGEGGGRCVCRLNSTPAASRPPVVNPLCVTLAKKGGGLEGKGEEEEM